MSEVAVKESENKDILQKMKHVEQDLQVGFDDRHFQHTTVVMRFIPVMSY